MRRICRWKRAEFSFTDTAHLLERIHRVQVPAAARDLRDCNLDWFFDYQIFPRSVLRFVAEWQVEGREMRVGDVIAQQAQVPPAAVSVKLLFGVRVRSVEHTASHAAFSYGTLAGHPETGTNEFAFSRIDGTGWATVRTTAESGHWLSRLLAPIFTNPYVAYCNRRALEQMASSFVQHNPSEAR